MICGYHNSINGKSSSMCNLASPLPREYTFCLLKRLCSKSIELQNGLIFVRLLYGTHDFCCGESVAG